MYSIIVDRTSSLLKHTKKEYEGLTLSEKLYRIKILSIHKNDYCKVHLTSDLINKLYKWKNKRNELIHDLI